MRRILTVAVVTALAVAMAMPASAEVPGEREAFVMVFFQPGPSTTFLPEFGHAKPDGRTHQGVDVFADHRTPVLAAADGKIRRMRSSARSGYYIVIDHADDYSTWYLHLDNDDPGTNNGRGGALTAFVEGLEVGDYVAAGQVIGYVGNSGNAEGTHHHTHFELRLDNRPIDPYPYLLAAQERWVLESAIDAGETPFR